MTKAIKHLSRYDREMGRTLAEVEIPPAVIDINMIREELVKIAPQGLVGSTFKAFYKIESVDRLSLERLNILQIDNLWMMKKITTLSLANNQIYKIENLEMLVSLVDLNLSYNNIETIENLESLVNIEKLSLHHNKISVVQNLESLTKLTILSIGANLIQDKQVVLYLRRIESLRSVNLDGNPCAFEAGFRLYAAVLMPQVVYFGYTLVTTSERIRGKQLFHKEYSNVLKEEKEEANLTKAEKEKEKRKQFLKLSYVDQLEGEEMYEALFKDDADGQALMFLQDKLQDLFETLKYDITKLSAELFKVGQKEYKRRCEEHDDFLNVLNAAKETGFQQNRSLLKEFDEFQVSCFAYLESVTNHFDKRRNKGVRMVKLGRLCSFYEEYYRRYWLALVGREIFLHDQLEDLISQFEARLGEQVNEFTEKSRNYFTLMRDAEMDYFESLSDRTLKYLAQVVVKERFSAALYPASVLQILRDKETVNNAVGTSHDIHLLVIDTTEDTLITSVENWFKDLIHQYFQDETERNRRCVLELINYMEGQHMEFMKQYKSNYKACKMLYTFVKKSLKARVRNFANVDDLEERRPTLALQDEQAKPSEVGALLGAKIQTIPLPKARPKKKKVVIVLPEKDVEKTKFDEEVDLFLTSHEEKLSVDVADLSGILPDEITTTDQIPTTDHIPSADHITPTDDVVSSDHAMSTDDVIVSTDDVVSTDDASSDHEISTDHMPSAGHIPSTGHLPSTDRIPSTDHITSVEPHGDQNSPPEPIETDRSADE